LTPSSASENVGDDGSLGDTHVWTGSAPQSSRDGAPVVAAVGNFACLNSRAPSVLEAGLAAATDDLYDGCVPSGYTSTVTAPPILSVENLRKTYRQNFWSTPVEALKGISLTV